MKGLHVTSVGESPEVANRIQIAAEMLGGNAVQAMIEMSGAHPVTGICCLIDYLSFLLRGMDKNAANEVLKDLASGRVRKVIQREAMDKLLQCYEAQVELMEHTEAGGQRQ